MQNVYFSYLEAGDIGYLSFWISEEDSKLDKWPNYPDLPYIIILVINNCLLYDFVLLFMSKYIQFVKYIYQKFMDIPFFFFFFQILSTKCCYTLILLLSAQH